MFRKVQVAFIFLVCSFSTSVFAFSAANCGQDTYLCCTAAHWSNPLYVNQKASGAGCTGADQTATPSNVCNVDTNVYQTVHLSVVKDCRNHGYVMGYK